MAPAMRVVETASGIAAAYCGKLLADAGADVTLIEPAGGHPLRRRRPVPEAAPGALFAFLAAAKAVRPAPAGGWADTGEAEVVLCDGSQSPPAPRPGLMAVSFSPFGVSGPWAGRPATEFTIQAMCGSTGRRGLPGRPPVYSGGAPVEFMAGSYAAAAVSAFAGSRQVAGEGVHLEVSLLEAGAVTMHAFVTLDARFRETVKRAARTTQIPSIEPTADGYVGFSTITAQQFTDFLLMIDRPDLAADESLLDPDVRQHRRDEVVGAIREWTTRRSTAEIIGTATAYRIPVAPIGNGANLPEVDHLLQRRVFETTRDGLTVPRRPYRISGFDAAPVPSGGAPGAGRDQWKPGAAPAEAGRPLAGLRVADFTAFWAGPAATHLLAALGADVIKVESPARPDGMRFTSSRPQADDWLEWSAVFHGVNANKRSVALDLRSEDGLARARDLIRWADVVAENFSPRVLDDLGLAVSAIHQLNPAVLIVRMPAFGLDGPWRDRTGFAMTVEQASGLAWQTGYSDGPPMDVGGVCDPLCGMHAVVALMAALRSRAATGRGALIEVPLVEVALNVAAEQVVQHSLDATLVGRASNHGPEGAPQGVYPAAGEDKWVALTVRDDAEWKSLASLLGEPGWSSAPELAGEAGRRAHAAVLDRRLAGWTRSRSQEQLVALLVEAGIPAAEVVPPAQVAGNAQLRSRGFFEVLDHPVVGRYEVPSLPVRLVGAGGGWYRTAAPTVGQHSAEVLQVIDRERSDP